MKRGNQKYKLATVVFGCLAITICGCNQPPADRAAELARTASHEMNAGKYSEAFEHLEEAVILKPKVADYHVGLGMAAIKLGNKDAANEHYVKARLILSREAETDPDRVDDYAMIMTLLAQPETARDIIRDGSKRFPDSETLKTLSASPERFVEAWTEFVIGK
jgi:Flp pilus assembly protein TadD